MWRSLSLLLLLVGCASGSGEADDPTGFEPATGAGGLGDDDTWGSGPPGAGGEAGEPSFGGAAGAPGAGGAAGAPAGGAAAGEPGYGGAAGAGGEAGALPIGGGSAEASCPSGSAPTPVTLRFDVATLNCGSAGVCSPASGKCFCPPDFDALNSLSQHLMAVATDQHKAKIWAAGNQQAVYVNDLNVNVAAGGAARANAVLAKAASDFPCGVPSWFVVNEISAGLWPGDASYRQFVVDFAKTLAAKGKKVIVAAPFATPGANAASWTELQKHAFIGVENYLSGAEVNQSGNSVGWCQAKYQASIDAYGKLGVPKGRLVLFEHFGNTGPGVEWGRGGVSVAGWHNAIKARAQAIANLGFAGFVSYGWGNNDMAATNAERVAFMKTYTSATVP